MNSEQKLCNRKACRASGADHWNTSTRAWYCKKCAEAINAYAYHDPVALCLSPYDVQAFIMATRLPIGESIIDEISKGSVIEYRSGWLATVFDVTDITWLEESGGRRASARIWSRADGREWYHTHRYDGVSHSDHDADIVRILSTPPTQPISGGGEYALSEALRLLSDTPHNTKDNPHGK